MAQDIEIPGKKISWHYKQVVRVFGPALLEATGGFYVAGREYVSESKPALLCANHISYLDPPLVGMAALGRVCFMAKASLFRIPLLGPFIRKSYSYPVDREEGGRQAIRIATTLLDAGERVAMFPEGTRSPDGEPIPGMGGPALVAARSNVPVIPMAIWGSDVVLPLHSKRLYRCPVYLTVGKPIDPPQGSDGGRAGKEERREFTHHLMQRIAELQRWTVSVVPEYWLKRAEKLKARWHAIHAHEAEELRRRIEQERAGR